LSEEEQASIRSGLHWFGDLALGGRGATEQDRARALAPAQRSAVAAVIVGLSVMLMLGLGFVILVLFVVLWSFGHIREAVAANSGNGAIYAETFAWYMLLFLGLSYLMRLLNVTDFLANMIVMFGSLLAVAWPWLRGVSWETVREDIGLKGGWIDVLAGVGTYLSALPLLVLGILTSLGMMLLYRAITGDDPFMPGKGPSHPAAEVMFSRNWVDWVQMFVLAGICAPVVEEILFRGVLYRHFRDLSHRWAAGASFLFAALMSSFVFAAIHPQGIFGVPVLMALALAFSMAREWRGSLMPAIVAHGINNSAVTLLLLVTSI
jgi:membrane protease YdiL (CAAX protease family)